jgi:release factor glutamine methyltransferase
VAERVWTVRGALDWTCEYLEEKGVERPRVSAEWLLSAATGLSRVELYAYHDRPLAEDERASLREGVRRRAEGVPLQYVTGEMPFRHIVINVSPGVFIPRPETEVLVEEGLKALSTRGGETAPIIVDLCVGSGCIACALATEVTSATIWATDLSAEAIESAGSNAERLEVAERVHLLEGDLFDGVPDDVRGKVDLVISNPPYIPSADLVDVTEEVVGYEPHLALDGGADGLDVARRIMSDARHWLAPRGVIAMELDEGCVQIASKEMEAWYEDVKTVQDLAGRDRVVTGVLR